MNITEQTESCDACGALDRTQRHNEKSVCARCAENYDRAADALANGSRVIIRNVDGTFLPHAWIQSHDYEWARVSFCQNKRPDEYIEIDRFEF